MFTHIRRSQAALGIAAVAAVGAVGIGTQAGAASKGRTAAKTRTGQHDGRAAHLATLAARLGVTSAQLKTALEALRPTGRPPARGDRHHAFAAAIARELGVETSAVIAVLEANRPGRPERPANGRQPAQPREAKLASALASALSKDMATVMAALAKLRAAHEAERDRKLTAFATKLAEKLGLSDVAAVKTALAGSRAGRGANGPCGPGRGHGGRGGRGGPR